MAQESYNGVCERVARERLVERGMAMWQDYAADYQELPSRYEELLAKKRVAKLPLRKINAVVLREYPEIPLLRCETVEEADQYLSQLRTQTILMELARIAQTLETDYTYNSLLEWVKEAEYLLAHLDRGGRFCLAMGVTRPKVRNSSRTRAYHYTSYRY